MTITNIYGDTVLNTLHLFIHFANPMTCYHDPYSAAKETDAQISWPTWSSLPKNCAKK